jgi:hypothetical protein
MFEQMVSTLKNGTLPENDLLRKRFAAALTKKMGVIKAPYSFWPADTKINPSTRQLLWAAILLHDEENFSVVAAIISAELEERQRAKGEPVSIPVLGAMVQQLIQDYTREFIALAPNESFAENLRNLAREMFPAFQEK